MLKLRSAIAVAFFFGLLGAGFLVVGTIPQAQADEAGNIQDDIASIQKKLKKAEERKQALETDLKNINSSLSATQRTIVETQIKIRQTELTIERQEDEIELLQTKADAQRLILTELLQELARSQDLPLPSVLLAQTDLALVLTRPDQLLSVQQKITALLDTLEATQRDTEQARAVLQGLKDDHQDLLQDKLVEKRTLAAEQQETVSDIEDQQSIIKRLNRELDELQSDLSKILGKSYNAKDIEEAVDFASKRTGVPKGFLMGVLKMETNLGANVGGCTYAEVEAGAEKNYQLGKLSKRSWSIFQSRRKLFKEITGELDIDYKKQKVSCNPRGYRGTGGAMGVAQFMPDTWMAYKSAVSAATGHGPPSPWNLTDGVMAMALKLDRVPGVDEGNRSAWKRAAAAYLGTSYAPYINGILYWADHYKELL